MAIVFTMIGIGIVLIVLFFILIGVI